MLRIIATSAASGSDNVFKNLLTLLLFLFIIKVKEVLYLDINKLRKEKKLTQSALAKAVGVSITTIRLWEEGVTTPNNENYIKLCAALGV